MARQRPTLIPTPVFDLGVPQVEIDRIVIREYQLDVNWCRNEEVIGAPGLVMWPCIVSIDRIAIREVKYQFEVNRLKCNFGWVWSMWAWRPRIDCIVIREVQYQFEFNPLKGNFVWVWPMWAGRPRVGIDHIVIREVQYQFEVNWFKNEEVKFPGSSADSDGRIDRRTDRDNHN
ncbi:hypothetical protein DPMN_035800 [Dreissena polymorpha]|uniref:Uncharacterized protein n=1 Tax=Dreissena polymorpha TaxID=45954 RepID=A0A9D4RN91_DREPO|nr:hypothetical protein DPMN_035800 [Dreissena polymorpha]